MANATEALAKILLAAHNALIDRGLEGLPCVAGNTSAFSEFVEGELISGLQFEVKVELWGKAASLIRMAANDLEHIAAEIEANAEKFVAMRAEQWEKGHRLEIGRKVRGLVNES